MFKKQTNQRQTKSQAARRSPITTYYRSENQESQSPFTRKAPKKRSRRYLLGALDVVLVIVVLFGLGYSLLVTPDPKVIASSESFHSQANYRSAAAAQLKQFNNRNKITFNEQAIAKQLEKQFPEINDVQIELPLFSEQPTIRLSISEASFYLNSHGNRYIVDSSGKAVARASDLPAIKNLTAVDDQSGYPDGVGRQILSSSSVIFISNLMAQARNAGVPVTSLTLPAIPQEIDLRTKDQPYYVKFYLDGDVLAQAGQFLAARKHFIQAHQAPSQYLDVRVSGKIFYK
jgi:cell division septal protein FtsQ